jgi:hypothetical protein
MKRRWLIARPWVKDIGAGIGLVIFIIAAFWGMGPFVALIAAVLWPDQ